MTAPRDPPGPRARILPASGHQHAAGRTRARPHLLQTAWPRARLERSPRPTSTSTRTVADTPTSIYLADGAQSSRVSSTRRIELWSRNAREQQSHCGITACLSALNLLPTYLSR